MTGVRSGIIGFGAIFGVTVLKVGGGDKIQR